MPADASKIVGYYEPESHGEAWSNPDLREPRYSGSLERGLAILGCFTPRRPILGIAEVAAELDMGRGTTHRYMSTLLALGYLKQGAGRKYRLALRVTDLGMSALHSTSLQEHARPYLHDLSRQNPYSVSLAVLDGPDILYIDRVRSPHRNHGSLDLDLAAGARLPAHCTAMGKLLLAHLPEPEQRSLLGEMRLMRMGPNTITSKKTLRLDLERIQEDGLAVNDRELVPELHSIAAPVRQVDREIAAAMALTAHTAAICIDELVDRLGPHLIAAADRLSARLGDRPARALRRGCSASQSAAPSENR